MKNQKILLSVITPTLNNDLYFEKFLNSILRQKKTNFNLEILIVDGGSHDDTRKIAKKYKCRIIDNPYVLADPGVNLGIKNAKGEIFIILAVDNIFKDQMAFEKIVKVFEDKKITAAFPIHVSSSKDSIYTKYINQFTDPFNHFVYGYSSNGRTFNKKYKTIVSNDNYDIYDYSSNSDKPMIAIAQGFTIRKGFTRDRNNSFDDILPVIELLKKKKNIAFMHNVKLYHHTVRNLRHFINKQMWATINALQKKKYGIAHRRSYLSENQRKRIKLWPIYSLSILAPILFAIFHLIKDRDKMWVYHPLLSVVSGYTSAVATLIFILNKNAEYKRK